MRRLVTSHLVRIYTVSHSVFDFTLKPVFEAVGMSKFKGRRVFFHSKLKGGRVNVACCYFDSPGPSCSKLTTSLVNDSLKFSSSDKQIC